MKDIAKRIDANFPSAGNCDSLGHHRSGKKRGIALTVSHLAYRRIIVKEPVVPSEAKVCFF